MERQKQVKGVKQTLIEAYRFHQKKAKFVYHHEIRTQEIKELYNSMWDDFEDQLVINTVETALIK